MDQSAAIVAMLLVAVLAANLPYLTERLFIFGPRRAPKGAGWRVLELVLMAALTYGLGAFVEARIGQRFSQGWEFYAAGSCLFITLGFPGFVWRYLRRHPHVE